MNTRKNVLVIYNELGPCPIVGVISPLQYLSDSGLLNLSHKALIHVTDIDLVLSDIIIIVRGFEEKNVYISHKCKSLHKYVIYYLDDDLLNVPSYSLSYGVFSHPFCRQQIIEIMNNCNCLWTVNSLIESKYKHLFKKSILIDSVAPILDKPPCNNYNAYNEKIVIGFSGGLDHKFFLETFFAKVVYKLIDIYKEKIEFQIFGCNAYLPKTNQVVYVPYDPNFSIYMDKMLSFNWTLAVAPLEYTKFNECKYINKFIEYSSIKTPGVYSNVPPYNSVVVNKFTGLLADNTINAWVESIVNSINNPSLRYNISNNSYNYIKAHHNKKRITNLLMKKLPELTS